MGKLGNIGYGLYFINNTLLLVHPKGVNIIEKPYVGKGILEETIESAVEGDLYVDHKINRGFLDDDGL